MVIVTKVPSVSLDKKSEDHKIQHFRFLYNACFTNLFIRWYI